MRVCVFEDRGVAGLEPLTLTRPAFDLRCGAYTHLSRLRRWLGPSELGCLVRPEFVALVRREQPFLACNHSDWLRQGGGLLVNARWLPPLGERPPQATPHVGLVGGEVAYAVVPRQLSPQPTLTALEAYLAQCRRHLPARHAGGVLVTAPWDWLEHHAEMLCRDFALWPKASRSVPPRATVVGPRELVSLHPTVVCEPGVVLQTQGGPIMVDREVVLEAGTRIEGPAYLGPCCQIRGARISTSSLGPHCIVGGEVRGSLLQGFVRKEFEGYLGHSIVGAWTSCAPGVQVAEHRRDGLAINLVTVQGKRPTTRTQLGAILGEHSFLGLGAHLQPGTLGGAFTVVPPAAGPVPRCVPSFCGVWNGELLVRGDFEQALATAQAQRAAYGWELDPLAMAVYRAAHHATAPERHRLKRRSLPREQRQAA